MNIINKNTKTHQTLKIQKGEISLHRIIMHLCYHFFYFPFPINDIFLFWWLKSLSSNSNGTYPILLF